MNLNKLKDPFPADEIEWRVGQCGKKGNGQFWAMCLAYVTGRAIMDRLDEVCGPENWKVSYRFIPGAADVSPGVLAEISILVGDAWITKEDGAEQTDIESFKGGLSSALKRAGSAWGIGRYLYSLESGFAQIVDRQTPGARWGKTKDGAEFHWSPPTLPAWALPGAAGNKPASQKDARPQSGGVHPEQPDAEDGNREPLIYKVPFGKWQQRSLEEIFNTQPEGAIQSYIQYLEDSAQKKGKVIDGVAKEFIERASAFIAAMENGWAKEAGSRE